MTPADVGALIIVVGVAGGMLFLCGIIGAAIAGAKGRSRLLGFALGGCLGIFGIAGACIMGEGQDRSRQKRIEHIMAEGQARADRNWLEQRRRDRALREPLEDYEWEPAELIEPRSRSRYRRLD